MQLGMIGLGRMGANMSRRLLDHGHEAIGFDIKAEARQAFVAEGAKAVDSLAGLIETLPAPRTIWVMVPSGKPVESTIDALAGLLEPGDVVIDGGNSNYKDTIRRGDTLAEKGISCVDCGTSGGIWGLKQGYSMMVGGDAEVVERLSALFEALAPGKDKGWGRVGPRGSGHYVKMVHNGIEYGMMQAYAEGFSILRHKPDFELDLGQVAGIWRDGSVVRSWLLDLTAAALEDNPDMDGISPWVDDSGEGRWTVAEAIDLDVPAPVISLALISRLRSRDDDSYSDRLLAAMRHKFGGHSVRKE